MYAFARATILSSFSWLLVVITVLTCTYVALTDALNNPTAWHPPARAPKRESLRTRSVLTTLVAITWPSTDTRRRRTAAGGDAVTLLSSTKFGPEYVARLVLFEMVRFASDALGANGGGGRSGGSGGGGGRGGGGGCGGGGDGGDGMI